MTGDEIEQKFQSLRSPLLTPISTTIRTHLEENLKSERIDQITSRVKTTKSFVNKSQKMKDGELKYSDPFSEIQDQIGVRIVTYYKSDMHNVCNEIQELFRPIERKDFSEEKSSNNEFGYEGVHYISMMPKVILDDELDTEDTPRFIEIQIKTLFQHAWAQAEHDLTYKPDRKWTMEEKRYIQFIASQAWASDELFDSLFNKHLVED